MQDRISTLRGEYAAARISTAVTCLRVTSVVGGAIATLVALPPWLRQMDSEMSLAGAAPPPIAVTATASNEIKQQQRLSVPQAHTPSQTERQANVRALDASRYRVLADFLSERYRVSRESVERFVRLAYVAGHSTGVDPLLILAVMAVESSFNPVAESVMGAKGLMQIIPEYHRDKLRGPHGGEANVLDPEVNIFAGAKVLQEYATRSGNDVTAALRLYGGTGPDPQNPYADRVLEEWQRLMHFLRRVQANRDGGRAAGNA